YIFLSVLRRPCITNVIHIKTQRLCQVIEPIELKFFECFYFHFPTSPTDKNFFIYNFLLYSIHRKTDNVNQYMPGWFSFSAKKGGSLSRAASHLFYAFATSIKWACTAPSGPISKIPQLALLPPRGRDGLPGLKITRLSLQVISGIWVCP